MSHPLESSDITAGLARIEAIARALDPETIRRAARHPHARTAAKQPWLLAGVSDGMGLHTAVVAIEAGILQSGLGVFWEPPHFLDKNDDGTPVSPVHWSRLQNAAALEKWANDRGVNLKVIAADVIMAPDRDLKGNLKGEPNAFSTEIKSAFEPIREAAEVKDVVFVNSVAFGKWMSPREGVEPIVVPTVDFEGRIIEMRTKKFHARGYQETLDTMGRNHKLLLEALRGFGWLGPQALTAFFTWAGGSQNVDVLEGIYGKGALGDAKVIAEADVCAFRLEHGLELGAHAMVRLPAFLSAALMGIPGGGLFGLVSRRFLEERGLFEGMPRLAERMLDRMFGPQWIRENPVSQIELDTAECLYIEEISACVTEAQERIGAYWEQHPETRQSAVPLDDSMKLLDGLAPDGYPALLRRFDPSASPAERPANEPITQPLKAVVTESGELEISLVPDSDFRPDLAMVETLRPLAERLLAKQASGTLAVHAEQLDLDTARWVGANRVVCRVAMTNGGSGVVLTRAFFDDNGDSIGSAKTTLAPQISRPLAHADTTLLGEAVGPRMPVRVSLHETYGASADLATILQGPALIGFARDNLKAAGVFDEGFPQTWDIRIGGTVAIGDHLLTYARRESDGWVVTVVDDESHPVLQMSLR